MKILVIEDEKDISDLLKCSLEAEGFVVDAAMDGEKGCFMGRVNNYDLIILDLNLPKKNGEAVCREIRETGKTTPILILTVDAQINSKIRLLNSGGDDYLTKPFSFEELLARVKALLRRPKTMTKEVLRIGNLTLDKNKQTVCRAGREIYLTRKEFALLEYLMRNQGIVVSRSEILENVWDAEADPFSNTIETHILNLRRKIDKSSANKLIKTVSGRGYRIG